MSHCSPGFERIERARIEHVDAGIDMAAGDRLFLEADDVESLDADDAEGVLPLMQPYCHGRHRRMAAVEIEQLAITDIGQHVTVGYQYGAVGLGFEQCRSRPPFPVATARADS